jgi:hypothetical protein
MPGNSQGCAEIFQIGGIPLFLQRIHGACLKVERHGTPSLELSQSNQQKKAVLTSGKTHKDTIPRGDHGEISQGSSHISPEFFSQILKGKGLTESMLSGHTKHSSSVCMSVENEMTKKIMSLQTHAV